MDQRMLIPSETLIDERRDVTTDQNLRLAAGNEGFQVPGPGMIDTVLIRCDSTNYAIRVETDSALVLEDDFTTLQTLSNDLSHVDAYTDAGENIVVVRDYPYQEYSTVTVKPGEAVTFSRIRGEWILGLPVSY